MFAQIGNGGWPDIMCSLGENESTGRMMYPDGLGFPFAAKVANQPESDYIDLHFAALPSIYSLKVFVTLYYVPA